MLILSDIKMSDSDSAPEDVSFQQAKEDAILNIKGKNRLYVLRYFSWITD